MRASRARFALGIAVAGALAAAGAAAATGDDDQGRGGGNGPAVFRTQLTGYEEIAAMAGVGGLAVGLAAATSS